MKRYLYFPSSNSDWDAPRTVYILCGNPRIVIVTPITGASSFLWEQLTPDPLLFPVSFSPNNTSKNLSIIIPNNTPSPIKLRITLNGNTNNYKYLDIYTDLTDFPTTPIKGTSGNNYYSNTLEEPVPYVLAPYPPDGPQVIEVLNNTLIGVQLLQVQYRLSLLESVRITDTTDNSQQNINFIPRVFPYNNLDTRIKLKVNNNYTVKKTWSKKGVYSQEFLEEPYNTNLSPIPQYIADEYVTPILKGGTGNNSFAITPYTTRNESYIELFNINILKGGTGNNSFAITPYTTRTESYVETFNINILKGGTGNNILTRTPYTSNVVGG